jgi:hypothetical protein
MSTLQSKPALPAPGIPNLRQARKDQAKERAASKAVHPAGKALPAPAKKPAPAANPAQTVTVTAATRKAPVQSGRMKLRWTGDIAKAGPTEMGRRVEKADGTWDAIVRIDGKSKVIGNAKSRDAAYKLVVDWHHRDALPVVKSAGTTPKKAS